MDSLKDWKRDSRRGNYSILMGVMVFAIMGFSALAVDISLITMAELQVAATADAASHAALISYLQNKSQTEGDAAANFIRNRNKVAMGTSQMDSIRYGSYDHSIQTFCVGCSPTGNINAVEVTLSRKDANANAVELLLAPIWGINTHDVDSTSVTASQQRALMLVNDGSCSMMGGGGAAINVLRAANGLVLQYMQLFPQDGDMLGMAEYAELAAVAEEDGGGGTTDINVAPWAKLSEIDTSLAYLSNRFDRLCDTVSGCSHGPADGPLLGDIGGCTNPTPAINQGIDQIRDNTDQTYFRGMVVMSDGVFNCRPSGGPVLNPIWDTPGSESDALAACNLAYGTYDISIWTILWHNGSFDPAPMQACVKGIGFAQVSPSAAQLPAMYQAMLDSLPKAIVD